MEVEELLDGGIMGHLAIIPFLLGRKKVSSWAGVTSFLQRRLAEKTGSDALAGLVREGAGGAEKRASGTRQGGRKSGENKPTIHLIGAGEGSRAS